MGLGNSKPPGERLLDLLEAVVDAAIASADVEACRRLREAKIADILRLLDEPPVPDLTLRSKGKTALHLACDAKCEAVALRLLLLTSDPASVNARTSEGKTALALCEPNYFGPSMPAVVAELTKRGATV